MSNSNSSCIPYTLIVLFTFSFSVSFGQAIIRDTTIITQSSSKKLTFDIADSTWSLYALQTSDISIEAGEILNINVEKDTISIRRLSENQNYISYEIELSNKDWEKILYDKYCDNQLYQDRLYPIISIRRNKIDGSISFIDTSFINKFLKFEYSLKLNCIDTIEHSYIKPIVQGYLQQIAKNQIDKRAGQFASHLMSLFSLYDLTVPTEKMILLFSVFVLNLLR